MLWIAIVSIAMLFAGLTSGYIVRRQTGTWLRFDLPFTFWISTSLILISSVTMNWAVQSIKKDEQDNLKKALLFTLILGICFGICQFFSWKALVNQKIFFTGLESSASASYLYVLTALHLCHIVGGIVALSIVYFKAFKKRYTPAKYNGIKLCALYWHFLDVLWVYLFIFLLILR